MQTRQFSPAWLEEAFWDCCGVGLGGGGGMVGVLIFPVSLWQRKDFPSNSFYVVVVVKTEDQACGGSLPFYPFVEGTIYILGACGWLLHTSQCSHQHLCHPSTCACKACSSMSNPFLGC